MEVIKLNRTGDRPLAFYGTEIICESTKTKEGETSFRWDKVRVFKTERGFKVGFAKLTIFENEHDEYQVSEAKSKKEVVRVVRDKVPELESIVANLLGIKTDTGPPAEAQVKS